MEIYILLLITSKHLHNHEKIRKTFILNQSRSSVGIDSSCATFGSKAKEKIFIHHVYFWLKNPSSEADKNKLIEGLTGLSKVPTIRFHHIGTPASTNRSVIERGYSVSWMLFFDNLEEEKSTKNTLFTSNL
jgi:hypothetical protein